MDKLEVIINNISDQLNNVFNIYCNTDYLLITDVSDSRKNNSDFYYLKLNKAVIKLVNHNKFKKNTFIFDLKINHLSINNKTRDFSFLEVLKNNIQEIIKNIKNNKVTILKKNQSNTKLSDNSQKPYFSLKNESLINQPSLLTHHELSKVVIGQSTLTLLTGTQKTSAATRKADNSLMKHLADTKVIKKDDMPVILNISSKNSKPLLNKIEEMVMGLDNICYNIESCIKNTKENEWVHFFKNEGIDLNDFINSKYCGV